jgi:hypothetical protein
MVELVEELERITPRPPELQFIIDEAKAGEYHDYKNEKYVCGKTEAYRKLKLLGYIPIAMRIADGEFDEEADEKDKAMLRKTLSEGGINPDSKFAKEMFNV